MLRGSPLVAAVLLVAGCSAGKSVDEFCSAYWSAVAAYDARCAGLEDIDVADEIGASQQALYCPLTSQIVHGGAVRYDPRAGEDCLSRLRNARCGPAAYSGDNPCERALVGLNGNGGDCVDGAECISGTFCGGYARYADAGSSGFPCNKTTCVAMASYGAVCTSDYLQPDPAGDSPCAPSMVCSGGRCGTRPRMALRRACSGMDHAMGSASHCETGALVGAACVAAADCAALLTCQAGVCVAPPRLGASCDASTGPCLAGWCSSGTCVAYLKLGDGCAGPDLPGATMPCGPRAMCRESLTCEEACDGNHPLLFR